MANPIPTIDNVIISVAEEIIVPTIAVIRSFVFWKIPAMPNPIAKRSRKPNPKINKPTIIATADSSSIPP